MQITFQPRPGGSIDTAAQFLGAAQQAAGEVLNDKAISASTPATLSAGVQAAKQAAIELFSAAPRSDFQDLVAARQQVIAGQQALEQAIGSIKRDAPITDSSADVMRFANVAFDAFENAFEIIQND